MTVTEYADGGASVRIHPERKKRTENVPSAGRAQRGRKAAPLAGTRVAGARTPVHVTLVLASGGDGWVRCRTTQGETLFPLDMTIWGLMERVQRGEYYIRPKSSDH